MRDQSASAAPTPYPGQQRILLSPPATNESDIDAVVRAMRSGWVAPAGAELTAFETELARYTDAESALALVSGSAALHLALIVAGVQPGDEVVVQTATFAASAFAVCHAGAVPVFCDVDRFTGTLDPDLLADFLARRAGENRLPAAVMPVDLYGFCADYERIQAVCEPYRIPIVQDAAEALGTISRGRSGGTHGTVAALSFNGNKIITTGGGGALLGPLDLVTRARKLANQAREPVPHYEHEEVGFNHRMSNILAALGRSQLTTLEERVAARGRIAAMYGAELRDVEWMPAGVTERPNNWLTACFLPEGVDAARVVSIMDDHDIEVRRYWKPMHMQPVFIENEAVGGSVAESYFRRGLCLPSSHVLTAADMERIVSTLRMAITQAAHLKTSS